MSYRLDYSFFAKESYLGFSFAGKHSSEFNIVRVNTDRYEEEILPPQSSTMVDLSRMDGTTYIDRRFEPRQFSVEFSFDSLTEEDRRKMVFWLKGDKLQELRFDERPYVTYMAKVEGRPTINFIPFDDKDFGRVYKGDGIIEFISPSHLGRSTFKDLTPYRALGLDNIHEWGIASGIRDRGFWYDSFDSMGKVNLYNPGDEPSDFKIYFKIPTKISQPVQIELESSNSPDENGFWIIPLVGVHAGDTIYCMDTKLRVIYSVRDNLPDEVLSAPIESNWAKIPLGESTLTLGGGGRELEVQKVGEEKIHYNYYYY